MHHDQTHSAPTGVIELRKIPAPTSSLRKRDTETRIGYMGTLGMAANPPTTDPRQMASAAWTYQYVVPNPVDGVVEVGVAMAVSLLCAYDGRWEHTSVHSQFFHQPCPTTQRMLKSSQQLVLCESQSWLVNSGSC